MYCLLLLIAIVIIVNRQPMLTPTRQLPRPYHYLLASLHLSLLLSLLPPLSHLPLHLLPTHTIIPLNTLILLSHIQCLLLNPTRLGSELVTALFHLYAQHEGLKGFVIVSGVIVGVNGGFVEVLGAFVHLHDWWYLLLLLL